MRIKTLIFLSCFQTVLLLGFGAACVNASLYHVWAGSFVDEAAHAQHQSMALYAILGALGSFVTIPWMWCVVSSCVSKQTVPLRDVN